MKMKLSTKLIAGFMSVAFITLLVGTIGFYGLTQTESVLTNIAEDRIPDLQALGTLNTERMAIRAQTLDVWLEENSSQDVAVASYRRIQQQRAASWREVDAAMEVLRNTPRATQAGRDLVDRLDQQFRAWRQHYENLDATIARLAASTNQEQRTQLYVQYRREMEAMIPASDAMGSTFEELTDNNTTNTNRIAYEAVNMAQAMELVTVIAVIIGVVLAITLGILIGRSVSSQLTRISDALNESSDQVASAAGQVSGASQSLAEGATEQAASLEETSSALEEMASMARQNADNSSNANKEVADTQGQVQEGSKAVKNMAAAMGEISDSSDKISNIIKTIEEIAFQTNLLALNAAVEAARAGDAGKGFAVVADEVRNLAQRAGQAARDTAALIEGTVTRVRNGTEIVEQLEVSFGKVEKSAGKVAQLISEISAASSEQAQGVDQVNTAVAQMDKVTQSNAANAEESASASEELSAQADQLRQVVGDLIMMVTGSTDGASHSQHVYRSAPKVTHTRTAPGGSPSSQKRGLGAHSTAGYSHQKRLAQQTGPAVVKSNDVIPFDDDEDFSNF